MSDFPLWSAGSGLDILHTPNTGTSRGQAMTAPGSTHTKAAWTELTAATSRAYSGIYVQFGQLYMTGGTPVGSGLCDIGIGGSGSEIVIIPDVLTYGHNDFDQPNRPMVYFPLAIASGTRVSARYQASTTNSDAGIGMWGVPADPLSPSPYGRATAYGENTGTSRGVTMDCGATANTKVYAQVVASTTNPIKLLYICIGGSDNATRSGATFIYDIKLGGTNGPTLIPDIYLTGSAREECEMILGPFPLNLPSGVELGVKAQCRFNAVGGREFDVVLIGID